MGVFRDESANTLRTVFTGRTFLVLAGLLIFLVAAVYLQTGQQTIDRSYRVVGSAVQTTGRAAFRVIGFVDGERRDIPVEITGATLYTQGGETPLTLNHVGGRGPTDVVVDLPDETTPTEVRLHVAGKAGVRTLNVPVHWGDPSDTAVAVTPNTNESSVLEGAFRLDVVPMGGSLVAGVDNTLLIRVRNAEGGPVTGAQVTVKVGDKQPDPPGVTDRSGLWSINVPSGPGALSLEISVRAQDGTTSRHERLVPTTYSKTRLIPPGLVIDPQHPQQKSIDIQVLSFHGSATMFCDIWQGGVLRHAWSVPLSDGRATLDVTPAALYDQSALQCYYHASDPGNAPVLATLVRGPADNTERLRSFFNDPTIDRAYVTALPPDADLTADERNRLRAWFFSSLTSPVIAPVLLLDTAGLDAQRLADRTQKTRTWLLWTMAATFAVIILWMIVVIILGQRRLHQSYNAYRTANPDDDGALDGASFSRAHGRMHLWVIGAIVVANVIAFILLLMLVVGH